MQHATQAQVDKLLMPGLVGIERTANLIEIRLALAEYRDRYGPDGWRLFDPSAGMA